MEQSHPAAHPVWYRKLDAKALAPRAPTAPRAIPSPPRPASPVRPPSSASSGRATPRPPPPPRPVGSRRSPPSTPRTSASSASTRPTAPSSLASEVPTRRGTPASLRRATLRFVVSRHRGHPAARHAPPSPELVDASPFLFGTGRTRNATSVRLNRARPGRGREAACPPRR